MVRSKSTVFVCRASRASLRLRHVLLCYFYIHFLSQILDNFFFFIFDSVSQETRVFKLLADFRNLKLSSIFVIVAYLERNEETPSQPDSD